MATDGTNWTSALAYDQWVALSVSGSRPPARYKHAATVIGNKLYVTGGSRNGRYLSDVQVFDLINLAWCPLKLQLEPNADKTKDNSSLEVFPPTSGHSMIYWAGKLLLVGGLSKNDSGSMTVRFIDLESHHYGVMDTFGEVPVARSGQSVTTVGSRLIMFGGEDKNRKLLNDVHVLDLEIMTWNVLETMQPPPSPRFDHVAAVHAERYLLIFGGCSHSIFFNELHILDLQTREWSKPQIQDDSVTARAGHAGIAIDDNWYIVGGGDNKNGAPETLKLNMRKLVLSVLTSVKERHALASEGLSVSSAILNGEKLLIAFGGYNGNHNNEVFVMRPKPRDSSHPKIFQSEAAAAVAASVTAAYALNQSGKLDTAETENSNVKSVGENGSQHNLLHDIDAIREENRALESLLAEIRADNSSLKEKIDETSSTSSELFKELRSFKGQLGAERSRCVDLEAQIAEIQRMLESLRSVEEKVQELRRQKSELEREAELATADHCRSSGGVWKWMAG